MPVTPLTSYKKYYRTALATVLFDTHPFDHITCEKVNVSDVVEATIYQLRSKKRTCTHALADIHI
jgi:hypothetical protein